MNEDAAHRKTRTGENLHNSSFVRAARAGMEPDKTADSLSRHRSLRCLRRILYVVTFVPYVMLGTALAAGFTFWFLAKTGFEWLTASPHISSWDDKMNSPKVPRWWQAWEMWERLKD